MQGDAKDKKKAELNACGEEGRRSLLSPPQDRMIRSPQQSKRGTAPKIR